MPRILALDYGERRIGVAVSDEAGIIAMPLCTIHVEGLRRTPAQIQRICEEKAVKQIVVGMPVNMDGSHGPQADKVSGFVKLLKEHLDIPVVTQDERLSTRVAERVLVSADLSRRKRRNVIDKLAAQAVLQSYLDSEAGSEPDVSLNP